MGNMIIHPIESTKNLGRAVSAITEIGKQAVNDLQYEWNNPEEARKKRDEEIKKQKDRYYAKDAHTRRKEEMRTAGYLLSEIAQIVIPVLTEGKATKTAPKAEVILLEAATKTAPKA
jgi:hypothetical protein